MIVLLLAFLFLPSSSSNQCCYPDLYEVSIEAAGVSCNKNGGYVAINIEAQVYADLTNQQVRLDFQNGAKLLSFFKTNTSYFIYKNTCQKTTSSGQINNNCVPSNASVTDKYRFGYQKSINAIDYTYGVGDSQDYVTRTFTESCEPLIDRSYINNEDSIGASYLILKDFVPTIRNSSVFDIPAICKQDEKANYLKLLKNMPLSAILLNEGVELLNEEVKIFKEDTKLQKKSPLNGMSLNEETKFLNTQLRLLKSGLLLGMVQND